MVFVPGLGVAQCEMRMQIDGQLVENTLYFYLGANPVDSDFTDLGGNLVDWWTTSYRGSASTNLVLRDVYITDLSESTAPVFTVVPSPAFPAGQQASPALPNNVALAVSFRTNGRGRSARGRNFFVGLVESQVTNSVVDSTTRDSIQAAYNQLLNPEVVGTAQWIVFSRYLNGSPRSEGLKQPVTTALITNTVVDSQRRRLPGRGR